MNPPPMNIFNNSKTNTLSSNSFVGGYKTKHKKNNNTKHLTNKSRISKRKSKTNRKINRKTKK